MPRSARLLIATAVLCALAGGCGYSLRPPYNQTVKTIHVPIFKSGNRFRQDLNVKLTAMVVHELNDRSPYHVVANPEEADVTLEGLMIWDDKNATVENPYNLPRHIMATMSVEVTLIDNRSGAQKKNKLYPKELIRESATYDPEIGEPTMAGFEKVMEKIARDIVNMLEEPWGEAAVARGVAAADNTKDDPTADRMRR